MSFRAVLMVAVLCLALNAPTNGQSYALTSVTGSEFSTGTSINRYGQVSAYKYGAEFNAPHDPYLWSEGQIVHIGNGSGQAEDINASGTVVGWTYVSDPNALGFLERAFIFDNGNLTLLDTETEAYALNERRQVVGQMNTKHFPAHAFLFSAGVMTDLGTLPGTTTSKATDINNAGLVVGWSKLGANPDSQSTVHGFLYRDGKMTDIGSLAGGQVEPLAINDLGQVVGIEHFPTVNRPLRGFLYDHGVMTEIAPLSGDDYVSITDINNSGQVVGRSVKAVGSSRAFIYQDGQMVDISHPTGPAGPQFSYALAINNLGQILIGGFGPPLSILSPQPAAAPTLLAKAGSEDSVALSSILSTTGPFAVNSPVNFSSDQRTRVMLFVTGLGVPVDPAKITAQAENAQHLVQPLTVEHVGSVPNFEWITQINVILPNELSGAGDVRVRVSAGGAPSNQALLNIK